MKAHLRLAERQGLLRDRHLSPVQTYALVVLNHLEVIKEARAERDHFKMALISRAEYSVEKIFPEYFADSKKDDVEQGLEDPAGVDYSEVEWKAPNDSASAYEQWEKVMARLQGKGELTGDDLVETETREIEWTDWV